MDPCDRSCNLNFAPKNKFFNWQQTDNCLWWVRYVGKPFIILVIFEVAEKSLETSCQALEIVNTFSIGEGTSTKLLSHLWWKVKNIEKWGQVLDLPKKKDKYGLRYKYTKFEEELVAKEKRENIFSRIEDKDTHAKRILICDIQETIQSDGFIYDDKMDVVEDDADSDALYMVYHCPPNASLNNRKIIEFPVIFNSCSM